MRLYPTMPTRRAMICPLEIEIKIPMRNSSKTISKKGMACNLTLLHLDFIHFRVGRDIEWTVGDAR